MALIDEIEHGLEPHRIARLIRFFKAKREVTQPQIFLTTHSPVVLQELELRNIVVTCRDISNGKTRVIDADSKLQKFDSQSPLRATPEAYLARSILVCEGKTEVGLVRGLDHFWSDQSKEPMATQGVIPIRGGGKDEAPRIAKHFRTIQYRTALLLDSDKDPDDKDILAELESMQVTILRWENGRASEDVLFRDLGDGAVCALVELLSDESQLHGIPDQIRDAFGKNSIKDWTELKLRCSEPLVRDYLAVCSKRHGWIKNRQTLAERVGLEVLGPHLSDLKGTNKELVLSLRGWIDG